MTPRLPLALALLVPTLFGTACAAEPDTDAGAARLAVVFVDEAVTQTVGSYDVATGELTFDAPAHDDLRVRLGAAGWSAVVTDLDETAEIEFDRGVVVTSPELADGDALELTAAHPDGRTLVLGRLVLRAAAPRIGNKIWQDDWLAPI